MRTRCLNRSVLMGKKKFYVEYRVNFTKYYYESQQETCVFSENGLKGGLFKLPFEKVTKLLNLFLG